MKRKHLPKSIRKYIRAQKARIRSSLLSEQEKKEAIERLYKETGRS